MRKSIARKLQSRHHNRLNAQSIKTTAVKSDDTNINSSEISSNVQKTSDKNTGKNIIKRISTIASKKNKEHVATVDQSLSVDAINMNISDLPMRADGTVELPDKKHVAICCINNVKNALKYTKKQIETMIINPLSQKYNTDIFMLNYNNDDDNDNDRDHRDHRDLYFKNAHVSSVTSEQLNTDVSELLKKSIKADYRKSIIDAYMEKNIYNVIKEFEKTNATKFDAIIFFKSDIFPAKKISIEEVSKVMKHNDSFYSSSFNDWNGYSIGYYIGTSNSLDIVLNRFSEMTYDRHSAEKILKTLVENSKIQRIVSNMFYFKIQKNGDTDVYYQLLKKYTSNQEYMDAQKAYQSVVSKSQNKIKESLDVDDVSSRNKSKGPNRRKHKRRSCAH